MEFQSEGKELFNTFLLPRYFKTDHCYLFQIISQKLAEPVKIEKWAAVNFSACCDVGKLCRDLHKCGQMKGIVSSLL